MARGAGTTTNGVTIALATILIVFIGFAPTFYLHGAFSRPPPDSLRVLHGVVFSLWPLLLVSQVLLIRLRRPDLHRFGGMLGVLLALAMCALGLWLAVDAVKRGFSTPGLPPPEIFLAIPAFDILVFAALVSAGVALRHDRESHGRLMILATLVLSPAAFARMPLPISDPILRGFGPAIALVLIVVAVDVLRLRRIERAWIFGASLFVASAPVRLLVAQTNSWHVLTMWIIGE